jgi:hypothetical protein
MIKFLKNLEEAMLLFMPRLSPGMQKKRGRKEFHEEHLVHEGIKREV